MGGARVTGVGYGGEQGAGQVERRGSELGLGRWRGEVGRGCGGGLVEQKGGAVRGQLCDTDGWS